MVEDGRAWSSMVEEWSSMARMEYINNTFNILIDTGIHQRPWHRLPEGMSHIGPKVSGPGLDDLLGWETVWR